MISHLLLESGSDKLQTIDKDIQSVGILAEVRQIGFCHYEIRFKAKEDLLLYKLIGKLSTRDYYKITKDGRKIITGQAYMFIG